MCVGRDSNRLSASRQRFCDWYWLNLRVGESAFAKCNSNTPYGLYFLRYERPIRFSQKTDDTFGARQSAPDRTSPQPRRQKQNARPVGRRQSERHYQRARRPQTDTLQRQQIGRLKPKSTKRLLRAFYFSPTDLVPISAKLGFMSTQEKSQATQWKQRWKLMDEMENQLLQNTSDGVKLRQFQALFQAAKRDNWETATPEEIQEVRQR